MNAFMIACKYWHKDIVEFLYDKIDNVNPYHYISEINANLYHKVYNIDEKVYYWGLSFNEPWKIWFINSKKYYWEICFIEACENWQKEIAEILYDKIDNINVRNYYWEFCFIKACENWQKEIAKRLYKKINNDFTKFIDMRALMLLTKHWRTLVKWFFDDWIIDMNDLEKTLFLAKEKWKDEYIWAIELMISNINRGNRR